MTKTTIIRFVLDIFIVIFLLGFFLALFWYISGSFEAVPTSEQQEKSQISAILLMLVTGVPCIICVAVRLTYKRPKLQS